MAGVSNRVVEKVAARHHTFIQKHLISDLTIMSVEWGKKSSSGFSISQLVPEILMQVEIYARSVIKSAYTDSDGLH